MPRRFLLLVLLLQLSVSRGLGDLGGFGPPSQDESTHQCKTCAFAQNKCGCTANAQQCAATFTELYYM